MEFNGRYFKMAYWIDEEDNLVLVRPDISDGENVTSFHAVDSLCDVGELGEEEFAYLLDAYSRFLWAKVDDRDWDHKESKEYKKKKCDHYYNDDDVNESIYVHDNHFYGIFRDGKETVLSFEWEAPMKDFVFSEKNYPNCVYKEKKVADVPSSDCAVSKPSASSTDVANSIHVAFITILVAVISALF